MRVIRRALLGLFVSCLAASTLLAEAVCEPKFSSTEFNIPVDVGQPFSLDLRTLLVDPLHGETLEWGSFGNPPPPAWLDPIPSPNDRLTGNPTVNDGGTHSFNLSVQCGDKGGFTVMRLQVIIVPKWKNAPNELFLGEVREDGTLDINLNDHVITADNSPDLTFTQTGLQQSAPWLKLEPNGRLHGTPPWAPNHPLVGDYNNIVFTVTHPSGGKADTRANGTVTKLVKPPRWKSDPITLPDVNENVDYDQATQQHVTHVELNPLTYELVSAPQWLKMDSTSGRLFGRPARADVGQVSATARVYFIQDGQTFEDTTTFQFKVLKVNQTPQWLQNPIVLPDAFTGVPYPVQDLSSAAQDPDNDPLEFTFSSAPLWASLSTSGQFSGTPAKEHVGENRWQVTVRDPDGATAETTVIVKVIKSNEPPYWLVKPTVLPDGKEDSAYAQDLKAHAKDPDNDPLTFEKLDGPAWGTINNAGFLVGTPKREDTGLQKFRIRVKDGKPGHFDDADVLVMVEKTNHAPSWVLEPVFQVKEDELLSEDLRRFVVDQDPEEELLFEIRSASPPSSWASIQPDGTAFGGTPRQPNVGENKFIVRVTDKAGELDEATVTVIVIDINHKPRWLNDPIVLPNATEGKPYNQSLASFAVDDDGETLTFSKLTPADVAWLNVRESGAVWGTPARADVGTKTFRARVTDPHGESADVTVHITVDKVNAPPRWTRNPIVFPDAIANEAFSFDVRPYAVDDDPEDRLTFRKQPGAGPAWLDVTPQGRIVGTPANADIGDYTTVILLSDGNIEVPVNARGRVIPGNKPPIISPEIAYILFENETISENLVSAGKISDPDGDALTCTPLDAPVWIALTANCQLTLTPKHEHIGDHVFRLRVSDGEHQTDGQIAIKVLEKFEPPRWTKDPIELIARTNEPFQHCVAQYAVDPKGKPLTFRCEGDPAFATCRPDGCITGMATDSDLGLHQFRMEAHNGGLGAWTNIHLRVIPGKHEIRVRVGEPVDGARVENLWVLDLSDYSKGLIESLRGCIHHYYNELNKAKIHHTGVVMSSDVYRFDGKPTDRGGRILLRWDDSSLVEDFRARTAPDSFSFNNPWWTDACASSPLWSMRRFYEQLPFMSQIYQKDYFDEFVPMDAMIVTCQRDHYPRFSQGYTPERFASIFKDMHAAKKKPYRVNRMTAKDHNLSSIVPYDAGPRNSYTIVRNLTAGKDYFGEDWGHDMGAMLRDYAKRVIERAYIFAKREIRLEPPPSDPTRIEISIGGKPLTSTQWSYRAAPPTVLLHWENIDVSQIGPNDWIVIEYPINRSVSPTTRVTRR